MGHPPLFSIHSQRLRIGLLLMTGLYVVASMRLNLSMGVNCMVNSTAYDPPPAKTTMYSNFSSEGGKCRPLNTETLKEKGYDGTLLWSPPMRSLLFSATFYGGLFTILVSGYLADRFGPKIIFLVAVSDLVVMTLLGPYIAEHSYAAYFASRIAMGLGEGFIFPCINSMGSNWFPPTEKSTMAAMYTSGNQLAAGFTSWMSAGICTSSLGWHYIFYIPGAAGVLWCVLFFTFASNSPRNNKWMREEEKEYLEDALSTNAKKTFFKSNSVPWRHLVWGSVVMSNYMAQFSFNVCASLLQNFLPTYFKEVLMLPIHMNGLYTLTPFMAQLISKNILGNVSDSLKRRKLLNPSTAVKIFQAFGSFGAAATLTALATLPTCENTWIALPILAAYGIFFSAGICGFFTSIITIAPPYTGTMTSVSMVYATLGNLSGPLMLSFIDYMGLPHKWLLVFASAAVLNVLTGTFYIINGSAKVQPWACLQQTEKTTDGLIDETL